MMGLSPIFLDGAHGFLFDGGQAARHIVAGRLGAADIFAAGESARFHVLDAGHDRFGHGRAGGFLGQPILAAHPLGAFRHQHAPALRDQDFAGETVRGVARQAGRGIRGAAFGAEEDLAQRRRRALLEADAAGEILGVARRSLDRADEAALAPDVDGRDRLARGRDVVSEVFGGHAFFFEVVDDDDRADIGVHGGAGQEAARHAQVGRDLAAAVGVHDRQGAMDGIGHALADAVGVDRARENQQVVADADIAVGAQVAHEF